MRIITFNLTTVFLILVCCSRIPAQDAGQMPQAVLIQYDDESISIVPLSSPQDPALQSAEGILLWADRGMEQWRPYPQNPSEEKIELVNGLIQPTRSPDATSSISVSAFTTQLDQLTGLALFRGNGFISPAAGAMHLNPKIVIRREAQEGDVAYPAVTLTLLRGNEEVLTFPVTEGTSRITWSEIPQIPESFQEGLTSGEYTLREADGDRSVTFEIESPENFEWVMEWPEELKPLLGDDEGPLYVHLVVEHLLGQLDEEGKPIPYYSDALDLIETLPEGERTTALEQTRKVILSRLEGEEENVSYLAPTGVPLIDQARELIANGKWEQANQLLDSSELKDGGRKEGLAALYRAVILTESGLSQTMNAIAEYRQASLLLQNSDAADRFRISNNYGGFLLNQTQDRLYNHAFSIATGTSNVLLESALFWNLARAQYESAQELASELSDSHAAVVEVNQARLFAVLADLIRTLDRPDDEERLFDRAVARATLFAHEKASAASNNESTDAITRASAYEILAQIAFRKQQFEESRNEAKLAEAAYLDAGSLAGVESVRRLRGLIALRHQGEGSPEDALTHLLISHEIAELLREQIPDDQIGISRAGFLARRTYVNELIIGLLVEKKEYKRALSFVELAKARSLEDVLIEQPVEESDASASQRTLTEILEAWPKNTTVLEYYLGGDRSWVFIISPEGEVVAHVLSRLDEKPWPSRQLVTGVKQLQQNLGSQAVKMRQRLVARQGFDNAWQQELHEFYNVLIPNDAREQIAQSESLIVIPHHVLHYFPFAALVTKLDDAADSKGVAKPEFWIDAGFNLSFAPSLSTWDLLRQNSTPLQSANAVGIVEFEDAPRLPGVELDLANMRLAFKGKVNKVVPGDKATEANVINLLQQPGLLLFSTHGQNLPDNPLMSYLLCRSDAEHDGKLTGRELYSMPIEADLIVMSACYSGLADRSPLPSDDLFGLQRALLHSGSQTVLSGLWDIYDATGPILINEFFERMANGEDAAKALTESQRSFLNERRNSGKTEPWLHPYFWAVYTVSGNDQIHFSTAK
ncbi:CHAT domain protein [Polystyrenella longa]|uniref:CHAT domain protein n=1 Tax=Polystyrenella longa TaxID=2528007 RepID=A0A518CLN8_9PLAN|nr:CHAT domain-containing protein [Polystyrenella longa]QDU80133.1 CHAT domain protein [Polystyrenella longa]